MHLVLAVSDVDRAYAFYRGVFGWESHIGWPGEYEEVLVTEDDRLGPSRPPAATAGRQAPARSRRISTATSPPRTCTSASTTSTGRSSASARPEPARSALEPTGTGETRRRTSPIRTETSSRSPHD